MLRLVNIVFPGWPAVLRNTAWVLKTKTNMAAKSVAKIFFSSSRQRVKCSFNFRAFLRRVNLIPNNYSVWLLCSKWLSPATQLNNPYDNFETSRDLCVTKSCQSKHRFTSFFGIPLASALFPWCLDLPLSARKMMKTNFQRPGKQPFFRSRTAKAAKRRARTEAARAESCKRCLFSEEDDENDQPPPVLDPPVLRKRETKTQQLLRINKIICICIFLFTWIITNSI